jgi:hypothetical protein
MKPDPARQLVCIEPVGGGPELAGELRAPLVGEDAIERGLSQDFHRKYWIFAAGVMPAHP